jgi:hypothetical protein
MHPKMYTQRICQHRDRPLNELVSLLTCMQEAREIVALMLVTVHVETLRRFDDL